MTEQEFDDVWTGIIVSRWPKTSEAERRITLGRLRDMDAAAFNAAAQQVVFEATPKENRPVLAKLFALTQNNIESSGNPFDESTSSGGGHNAWDDLPCEFKELVEQFTTAEVNCLTDEKGVTYFIRQVVVHPMAWWYGIEVVTGRHDGRREILRAGRAASLVRYFDEAWAERIGRLRRPVIENACTDIAPCDITPTIEAEAASEATRGVTSTLGEALRAQLHGRREDAGHGDGDGIPF